MSKRRHVEEFEIPFVALMDTMTNVVGVLIIVLVLVGLGVSNAVKKILSDLPPVTPEQLAQLKELMQQQPPVTDPKKLEEQIIAIEAQLKKTVEDLKSLDVSTEGMQLVSIDDLNKQLEEKKKQRNEKKAEVEKLLAELDKLKAALDQTPLVAAAPSTEVRLPNPRPYPEKPVETRVIVAKEGVLFLNDAEFMKPLLDRMEQTRSQFEYRNPEIAPFQPMLEKIFKSKTEPAAVWPQIAPLAGKYQMDGVANAYKTLKAGGLQPSANMLEALSSISLSTNKPLPAVADAVVAATKGDFSKWLSMDPTKDPTKPIIKVVPDKSKIAFHWGSTVEEVRPDQRGILGYFKTLSDTASFQDRYRSKVIYDAFKIAEFLKRAAASQMMPKSFSMVPVVRPGSTQVQLALTPQSGESLESMRKPNSDFILTLRRIKSNPSGVALFQVMPQAIATYLEARTMADEVGVPATWDFRGDLNVTLGIPGFEVQRFGEAAVPKANANLIAPPKKTLD